MKTQSPIAQSRVSRRDRFAAADRANADLHQRQLEALETAEHTKALIDAIKRNDAQIKQATRITPEVPATRGPQEPASAVPDGGSMTIINDSSWPVANLLLILAAMLMGFVTGRMLV